MKKYIVNIPKYLQTDLRVREITPVEILYNKSLTMQVNHKRTVSSIYLAQKTHIDIESILTQSLYFCAIKCQIHIFILRTVFGI